MVGAILPPKSRPRAAACRWSPQKMSKLVIEAGKTSHHYWRDLWRFRELFAVLAWRDISVRYKQTVIGITWAFLQPFLTMIIMTVVFGRLAGLPSEGNAPYAIMVFAGILPWQLFANSLGNAGQSLVGNAHLISKVYFPRLIIPASSMVVALIDFLIAAAILVCMMVFYQFAPTPRVVVLPGLILLALLTALGPALLLAALNVRYRDFRYVIPFIVQFGLYVSPVAYSSDLVREKFGETIFLLYSCNPMVGVIDGFRWAILGTEQSFLRPGFFLSCTVAVVLFATGLAVFRKTECTFADTI